MDGCIFCKIAKGEIPSSKVYEDDFVLAFLDLNPASLGHALVIPKKHAATLLDLEPGSGEALLQAMRKIGKALRKVVKADGFNCLQNNFSAAGQEVMHLHWHVIPRHEGDQVIKTWAPGKYENMEQMAALAGQLKAEI
ncbi:MAG: HIT family protein [Deltaproteobacteria bacterium]|jgi:histidine triad (HIT) family protein|nr:HIT family protein [Deltaproteobacteria bacterium]